MSAALTPEALIQQRFAAFMRHDFQAIYHSYHPDAPFLYLFPDCDTYLSHSAAEIAGTFEIRACKILRSCLQGETAEVLFSQQLVFKGEVVESLEIARCRRDECGKWSFLAGLRLDPRKLPSDLLHCSWDELLAAGSDLWI